VSFILGFMGLTWLGFSSTSQITY